MESGKTKLLIVIREDNDSRNVTVTFIDKVNDIRKIEAPSKVEEPSGRILQMSIFYPVVTKYLVEDVTNGRLFTIYVSQIVQILKDKTT